MPRRREARGGMAAAAVAVVSAFVVLDITTGARGDASATVGGPSATRLERHTHGVASVVASGCTDDEDCELLGSCRGGVCVCSAGFTGPTCGQLNLAPVDSTTRGRVWPSTPQPAGTGQIAWSFAPVYDTVTHKYNAVVEMSCGPRWGNQLSLWAVSSDHPTKDYTLQRRLTGVGPNSAHLLRLDNGTYVMHFFSMHVAPHNASAPVCDGNVTRTLNNTSPREPTNGLQPPPLPSDPVIPECTAGQQPRRDGCLSVTGGDYDPSCVVYAAFTDAWPDGPWSVRCVVIQGVGWEPYNATLFSIGTSNPTVTMLSDGRALAAFRSHAAYWPSIKPTDGMGGEHTGFALGPSLAGPFTVSANLSWEYGNDEDPFVWQQADGSMHCLYHNGRGSKHPNHGLHAFSRDGITWHKPHGALDRACAEFPHDCPAMYNNTVVYTDGTREELVGRERPSLMFDPTTRQPVALFTGVIPADTTLQWFAGAQAIVP